MATAGDIINRALRSIGVLATGETASAEMANDGLITLNDLLASLGNENLTVYANTQDSLTLTGATSYTYGSSGDVNSVRPVSVDSAFYRDSNGLDYPVSVITLGEYNEFFDKDTVGDIPQCIYVNMTYPLATVYVYPAVSSGTIKLNVRKQITAFSTLATTVSLPPGYDRMLRYNLAAEMMVEYGINNPAVYELALQSKADIKRTNTSPHVMRVALPFGRRVSARIESDGL